MTDRFRIILQPGVIGDLEIPNRVIKTSQASGSAHPDGSVSVRTIQHYRELAQGGTGLVIVEGANIEAESGQSSHCQIGIYDNKHISGLAWLAETIKGNGARAGIQIEHAGRQKYSSNPPIKSSSSVSWAGQDNPDKTQAIASELTVQEIKELVIAFGAAAQRAKMAGFDLVEIQGAHGYLITNFISPHVNSRKDEYGGSLENRMRFLVEIYQSVRKAVGDRFPISVRLNGTDYEPDGFGIEETIDICRVLAAQGVNAIHVSGGDLHQIVHQVSPMSVPLAHNVWAAEAIRLKVNIPIIASGSITTPDLAEEILESGKSDFIGLGRPLWADPDWVIKLKRGEPESIRPCIRCNDGCFDRSFIRYQIVSCSVNHRLGRIEGNENAKPTVLRNIAVIGGGPAGIVSALLSEETGHRVTLFERRELGGKLIEASRPEFKEDIKKYLDYLKSRVFKSKIRIIRKNFEIRDFTKTNFDTVIVAVGSQPLGIQVPGSDSERVYSEIQILGDPDKAGKSTVIVGGGTHGVEVALWLSNKGVETTIIEKNHNLLEDCEIIYRIALCDKLAISEVDVFTHTKLIEIQDNGVLTRKSDDIVKIECDSVIIATGYKPDTALADKIQMETDLEVFAVGDCVKPGKIYDAVHSASKIVSRL